MGTFVSLYLAKVVALASVFGCILVMVGTMQVMDWFGWYAAQGPVIGSMMIASFIVVPVVYVRTYRALGRRQARDAARREQRKQVGEAAPSWMQGR